MSFNLNPSRKGDVKNTSEDNLITFHFSWTMNMLNEFGMRAENNELMESSGEIEPVEASMVIVKAV
jgi:hypothetical protein